MKNILIFVFLCLSFTLTAQQEQITAKHVRATQKITLDTVTLTRILKTISNAATHTQGVTGKAVYDFVNNNYLATNAAAGGDVTGTLANLQIAAGAVGTTEIASGAVTTAKIAAGAVGTTEIASGAVTTAKIAAGAVGSPEIGNGTVSTVDIAAEAVTWASISEAVKDSIRVSSTATCRKQQFTNFSGTSLEFTALPLATEIRNVYRGGSLQTLGVAPNGNYTVSDLTVNFNTAVVAQDVVVEACYGGFEDLADAASAEYVETLDAEIQALRQTVGTAYNDNTMGDYTGNILTDDATIKDNVQQLSDALENLADAPKPYWNTSGNTGLSGNYLGTNDTSTFEIKINNTTFFKRKYVDANSDGLAFGVNAGAVFRSYTSGVSRSTAFGTSALQNDDGANRTNTAFGYEALKAATTGSSNVAVGSQALLSVVSATGCTGIGNNAGRLITGSNNTIMGGSAATSLTSGTGNVIIGFQSYQSGTGSSNVVIGNNASATSTSPSSCVVVGNSAGYKNTSGNCVFIGALAGANHSSGGNVVEINANSSGSTTASYAYNDATIIGANLVNSSALSNIIGIESLPTAANRIKIGRSVHTQATLNALDFAINNAATGGQILKAVGSVLTPVQDTIQIQLQVQPQATDVSLGAYPGNILTSFYRVPSMYANWKIVGATFAFFTAASGGNTLLGIDYNGSVIGSTTIAAGTNIANSASLSQTVASGGLIQINMPTGQAFTTAAKGLFVTIYLTR
jgi:hypothetical protein